MNGEISKDFYCSRYTGEIACMERLVSFENCGTCECYHRKWPTPEQYREKWGKDYPDHGAVYVLVGRGVWEVFRYDTFKGEDELIVCACTLWNRPPADWRPE